MRKSALRLVVVLAVLVGVVWYVGSLVKENGLEPLETKPPSASHTIEPAVLVHADMQLSASEEASQVRIDVLKPEPYPVGVEPDYPRSRVFGIVTGEDGAPLVGVRATLHSRRGRWLSKDLSPSELPAFEVRTNLLGVFELEVPLPTSNWVSLAIYPSEYHARSTREFGRAGGRNQEPLVEGANDLGTFVLLSAGAFAGSVFDENGEPIAEAQVLPRSTFLGDYLLGESSKASGAYHVGGVPAGNYSVMVQAEGFVTNKMNSVEVVNGEVTFDVDFVLKRASSISGHVHDSEGNPLGNVRLYGSPESGGQLPSTRSAADGSFRIFLPQDEPHSLSARLARYVEFDSRAKYFAPGTDDVEIVLQEPNRMTYVVRDAQTNAPIERFGLKIIHVRSENGGTTSSPIHDEPARVDDHPRGEVQMPSDVNFDYTVIAPGYEPQRGRVKQDVGEENTQTIRLRLGGTIAGRFTLEGKALAFSAILIQGARIPVYSGSGSARRLGKFAGRKRRLRGAKDGSFRIEDLSPGTYDLNLVASGGSSSQAGTRACSKRPDDGAW